MAVIYAYKKKSENKIVYVGQTIDLYTRHKHHVEYDPYNKNTREYNYPLSRGIRKYGPEEYELIILEENVPLKQLDEREKYWINFYDTFWEGYNQTVGGTFPNKPIYTDEKIQEVYDLLRDETISFPEISKLTGLSITHIYNLNAGFRRPQEGIEYPIRKKTVKGNKGCKFSQDEIKIIHEAILNTNKPFKELGKDFGCRSETISRINAGKIAIYHLDEYTYPLRKNPQSAATQYYWDNKN